MTLDILANTTKSKSLWIGPFLSFSFLLVAPTVTWLKYFKRDSIIVRVGKAIDIPAEIVGLPLPTFVWSKDGVVIDKPPETITLEEEEINRTTIRTKFSVPVTVRSDTGVYTLTATNIYGKAEPRIKVEILGKITHSIHICQWNDISHGASWVPNVPILFHSFFFSFRSPFTTKRYCGLWHQSGILLPHLECSRWRWRKWDYELHHWKERCHQEEVWLGAADLRHCWQAIRG